MIKTGHLASALAAAFMGLVFLLSIRTSAEAKDELVIGMNQFPSSLHPDIDAELIKRYVDAFVVRPITQFDKDWKITCLLCAELPTLENGLARLEKRKDGSAGMAVTIKLKPDLKWGDGQPVTARDIAFTWKVGIAPNSGFSNVHPWARADRVEVVSPDTAILHLTSVTNSFAEWDEILPEHIEGPVFDTAPERYFQQTRYNREPTTPGLFNGPFLIAAYHSGSEIILTPNPYWPGAKPGFTRIVLKLVENTAALQANLLAGDVDMIVDGGLGLTIDQILALRRKQPDRFDYVFKPALYFDRLEIQRDNPILTDLRVRQALLYAIDRKTMSQKLFDGVQPVADSFVNPADPMSATDLPHYDYDPAKAKSVLAEAGWTPGPDGICRNQAGERLSIEFITIAGNRLRELEQQVLQSYWKAACIETVIKNEPLRTLLGETVKKRLFHGVVLYFWVYDPNVSPRNTLASESIPTLANNYGGSNTIAYSNPEMDRLIGVVESELDQTKRRHAWATIQRLYATDLPVVPLFFLVDAHVIPKWLAGYERAGFADYAPLWAENWHAE